MQLDTIYCGEAIELLGGFPEQSVDLVFADPPFNIGYVYDHYRDDVPDEEYVAWTRRWMEACRRVLQRHGALYVAIGDENAAEVRIIGRELGLHLRNWIIWHYSFGQNMRTRFARSHTHIFYFVVDPKRCVFNDAALRYPGARHTEYQDLRAHRLGRVPDDVWDEFPRVCGTFRERAGWHGCQMPEALLMRIILASSRPGDVVLDPFVGSGTTAVAAYKLGRRYIGIDISPEYVARARQRLSVAARQSREAWAAGFSVLHAEMLAQLYRETKVSLENLLPNRAALEVMAEGLGARTGQPFSAEQIAQGLQRLREVGGLPKLPNDRPFVPRVHRVTAGKRYVRAVQRCRGRRSGGARARAGQSRRAALREAS